MQLRNLVLIAGLASMLFAIRLYADPTVTIQDSGFSPSDVDLGDSCTDEFQANVTWPSTQQEIPSCTYAWSVYSKAIDPNYGTDYHPATDSDCPISLDGADQQNCTVTATLNSPGTYYIVMLVTVTYPDGYCRVIRRELQGTRQDTRLAGSPSDAGTTPQPNRTALS